MKAFFHLPLELLRRIDPEGTRRHQDSFLKLELHLFPKIGKLPIDEINKKPLQKLFDELAIKGLCRIVNQFQSLYLYVIAGRCGILKNFGML